MTWMQRFKRRYSGWVAERESEDSSSLTHPSENRTKPTQYSYCAMACQKHLQQLMQAVWDFGFGMRVLAASN